MFHKCFTVLKYTLCRWTSIKVICIKKIYLSVAWLPCKVPTLWRYQHITLCRSFCSASCISLGVGLSVWSTNSWKGECSETLIAISHYFVILFGYSNSTVQKLHTSGLILFYLHSLPQKLSFLMLEFAKQLRIDVHNLFSIRNREIWI